MLKKGYIMNYPRYLHAESLEAFKYHTPVMIKGMVISREIRPLAALYPSLPYKKVLYRAVISSFDLDLRSQWTPGLVCSCLRHLRPFLIYQSKKNKGGGIKLPRV